MWLLVHFVLFCFRVFPSELCSPHWRQGSGSFTLHPQPPAGRGVELAREGREPSLPASSCRPLIPLLSPLPSSSQYGLLLRPRSVPSGRAAEFTWEFCPLSRSLRITDCIVRGQSPQGPQEGCPYLGTGEVWEGPWAVLRQCPGKGQGSYLAGLPMDGRLWGPPSSWSCPTPAPAGLPAATTLSTSLTPEGRFPICEGRGVIDLRGGGDVFWAFQGGLELFS